MYVNVVAHLLKVNVDYRLGESGGALALATIVCLTRI